MIINLDILVRLVNDWNSDVINDSSIQWDRFRRLQQEFECLHIGKACTYHFLLLHFSFSAAGVLHVLQAENRSIGPPKVLQPQRMRSEVKALRKIWMFREVYWFCCLWHVWQSFDMDKGGSYSAISPDPLQKSASPSDLTYSRAALKLLCTNRK